MKMKFKELQLKGAYIIDLEKITDQRGFFARSWCQKEFQEQGLVFPFLQANISYNLKKGTLRGMHYQKEPYSENKLVRCTKGSIYDVIIDLRADSTTYKKWFGTVLTGENHQALYIPKNFAHGYLTFEDNTEVLYQVSEFYQPQAEQGVRWNDPAFGLVWPAEVLIVSDKDLSWPDYFR